MIPPASHDSPRDWYWPTPPPLEASSFGEILEAIRPSISRTLLDGPGWDRVRACTRDLPADAANYAFGFEYQLQQPTPAADLCIAIVLHTPVARQYVSRGQAAAADPTAAALAEVLVESEREGSFLSRVIGGAIVEYDLATEPVPQAPGLFLACPQFWDDQICGYTNPGVLTAVLAAATAQPECAEERRACERLFGAIPAGMRIIYAGTFPGREARAIRLLISGVEPGDLSSLLERVNWPGSIGAVATAIDGFCDVTPYVRVAIEVGPDGVSPRLGLEMFQARHATDRFNNSPAVWRRVIDRLVERDLCLPEKAVGLRDAARAEVVSDPVSGLRTRKGIHHIKIVLHGEHVQAKAYAFFTTKRFPKTAGDMLRIFG